MKKISIGVPCYNEEKNIEKMYLAITEQMKMMSRYDYEIIFADNASRDKSVEILRKIALVDKKVKVIINQTNFGAARSSINCLKNASGQAYIGIPCDFQEPPEMIPQFVQKWEEGYDIVWGQKERSKESKIKYFCRSIFYKIIAFMSEKPQLEQTTGFGIMDRKVIDTILVTQMQDPEFSARHLVCEYGFNIFLIPYEQQKREKGKSSYNVGSYFSFAITSLCNTSIKPLHMMTIMGVVISIICFAIAVYYFVYKLFYWDSFNLGVAPLMIGLFFVSGLQMFCIGILGEYIGIIIRRITKKPLIIEHEKINFDKNDE